MVACGGNGINFGAPGTVFLHGPDSVRGDLVIDAGLLADGTTSVILGYRRGTVPGKVVPGFFSQSEIISTFDEPVQPIGASVLNQGAPSPK